MGNMISDFVKGKTKFDYPVTIQNGIALHRAIDAFTDEHSATKAAKEFFRPAYRLYAGAFIDVVYDHFLANDKNEFIAAEELNVFAQNVYDMLEQNASYLPDRFSRMFPYMKTQNWLYNYRTMEGIEKSFGGLQRRSLYITQVNSAIEIFHQQYAALKNCYDEFFPALKKFTLENYQLI